MTNFRMVLLITILLSGYQNCAKLAPSHIASEQQVVGTPSFDLVVSQVFTPKCSGCHNWANYAAVTNCSLVKPFKPDESGIYLDVTSGFMPPCGDHLSSYQEQLIRSWIEGGALDSNGNPPVQPAVCIVNPSLKATGSIAIACPSQSN